MKLMPGITYSGRISKFGGPLDDGVAHDEGLALYNSIGECPMLFLADPPLKIKGDPGWFEGTTETVSGLARRLNVKTSYCAMRWSYSVTPKPVLRKSGVMISANGKHFFAMPIDWGPHESTGRLIDASDSVLEILGVETDDIVKCVLMLPEDLKKHEVVV